MLGSADSDPDIECQVDARLVSAAGTPLHGSDIASLVAAGNNLVGKSSAASYAEWKSRTTPAAFGMVVELGTLFGRPLAQ